MFTHGKWKLIESAYMGQGRYQGLHPDAWHIMSHDGPTVIDVCVMRGGNHYVSRENARANANLIAAAPDLYQACKAAIEFLSAHSGPIRGSEDAFGKCHAAIALADGAGGKDAKK